MFAFETLLFDYAKVNDSDNVTTDPSCRGLHATDIRVVCVTPGVKHTFAKTPPDLIYTWAVVGRTFACNGNFRSDERLGRTLRRDE